jgi:hypothetical protein
MRLLPRDSERRPQAYRLAEEAGWDATARDWRQATRGYSSPSTASSASRQEADRTDKWQQTILWDFPENYKLYEHIKTKADGQAKTVKNHSGGGHDRQDAYLYGNPKGPRKRYRSPADFFPHLLWLCTDESTDYQNCTCKMCSPVQLDVEKPAVKSEVKMEPAVALKKEGVPQTAASAPGVVVGHNPIVSIPARRSLPGAPAPSPGPKVATPAAASTPTPTAQQLRPPAVLQSAPLPQPRGAEQGTDSRYGQFICRTGEVVWFFRPKTSAWGLGLIIRRWTSRDNSGSKAYLVQPMSYPTDSPAPEVVTTDEHLKPWLAWSAPACTYPYLQQNPQLRYDQVPWDALLAGQLGSGIADVDASIMAAKAIDTTYTLFDRWRTVQGPVGEDRYYNGIYLGAEKIWRGDPVRIRIGPGTDIMVVTDIIERSNATAAQKEPSSTVWLTGDIYSYATMSATDPSRHPTAPSNTNTNIPIRMRKDMEWRNRLLVPMNQTLGWWRLISSGSRVDMADIKGRWYETSLLFEDSFAKAVKNNEGGNGIWMNARGDATGLGRHAGVSRIDRVAAFGSALPAGTQLKDGLDPPTLPAGQEPQQTGLDIGIGASGAEAFSLDDFMNVDHLEDAGVDYSHGFGF